MISRRWLDSRVWALSALFAFGLAPAAQASVPVSELVGGADPGVVVEGRGAPIVVTGQDYRFLVAEQLRSAGCVGDVVLEPFRRDDDRIGVPLAQWRAPTRDEDKDIRKSAALLRKFLEAAGA